MTIDLRQTTQTSPILQQDSQSRPQRRNDSEPALEAETNDGASGSDDTTRSGNERTLSQPNQPKARPNPSEDREHGDSIAEISEAPTVIAYLSVIPDLIVEASTSQDVEVKRETPPPSQDLDLER